MIFDVVPKRINSSKNPFRSLHWHNPISQQYLRTVNCRQDTIPCNLSCNVVQSISPGEFIVEYDDMMMLLQMVQLDVTYHTEVH